MKKTTLYALLIITLIGIASAAYQTVTNPFTGKLDYVNSNNWSSTNSSTPATIYFDNIFVTYNVTANKFIGDGSLLTGIAMNLTPINNTLNAEIAARISIGNWTADKSSYYTSAQVDTLGNWSADKSGYTATVGLTNSHEHAWVNLTDYPAACPANNFMTTVGDSITCTSVQEIPLNLLVDNNLTVTGVINGNSTWRHQTYPAACPAGSAITQLGDAVTCTSYSTLTGNLNMSNNNITNVNTQWVTKTCYNADCTKYIGTNATGLFIFG